MNCSQVRELIPGWLEGEVEAFRSAKIEKHVNACDSCRNEVDFWQRLGTTLREDTGDIKAPGDFTAKVMAGLPEQESKPAWEPVARWKQGIAAAAAFLLVAAGSVGVYLQWGMNPVTHVVEKNPPGQVLNLPGENTPGNSENENPGSPADPGNENPDTQQGENNPGNSEPGNVEPGETGSPNNPSGEKSGNGSEGEGTPEVESNGTANPDPPENNPAGEMEVAEAVLLNTDHERVVERTLLRLQVEDLEVAHRTALDYINDRGASYEILATEKGASGTLETLKVVVANSLSGELMEKLRQLGQVVVTETKNNNITAQYNENVQQFRALAAELKTVEDPQEREQLQLKKESIKAQLNTWNREAQTDTIILWLES